MAATSTVVCHQTCSGGRWGWWEVLGGWCLCGAALCRVNQLMPTCTKMPILPELAPVYSCGRCHVFRSTRLCCWRITHPLLEPPARLTWYQRLLGWMMPGGSSRRSRSLREMVALKP